MKIKHVQLKQFKRFDDLTIDLGAVPPRIVALVGPNGCGKSSVFDAFERLLQQSKGSDNARERSFYDKQMFSTDPAIAVAAPLEINQAVKILTDDGPLLPGYKAFHVRSAYRFTSALNVQSIQAQPDILTDTRRPGNSASMDNGLRFNYERMIGQAWTEFEAGTKTGEAVRAELIGTINETLKEVLDVRISSLGNVMENRGRLYFEKDDTKDFPYENLSAGEKEVIDIVIDLVVKKAHYDKTIYCIDEPELHLNTAIQRKLLVAIEKLIPDECQLWVATHSMGFLRALQTELAGKSAVIDFSAGNFFKGAHTVTPMVPNRANWSRLFETALDDLVGLVAPARIVYCEGRAAPSPSGQEQGLDATVYNEIFAKTHADTLFVSSGGNKEAAKTSSLALIVMSKAFTGAELLLLRDRDTMSDADRANWLSVATHHRMTSRVELENYLLDYDVLAAYCKANGTVLDLTEYNTLVSDVRMQDLKANNTTRSLKQLCGAPSGMTNDAFKRVLAPFVVGTTACAELEANIF
jgi:predicted ATPase